MKLQEFAGFRNNGFVEGGYPVAQDGITAKKYQYMQKCNIAEVVQEAKSDNQITYYRNFCVVRGKTYNGITKKMIEEELKEKDSE